MPAKGSAEWNGDVTGTFTARWRRDERAIGVQLPVWRTVRARIQSS